MGKGLSDIFDVYIISEMMKSNHQDSGGGDAGCGTLVILLPFIIEMIGFSLTAAFIYDGFFCDNLRSMFPHFEYWSAVGLLVMGITAILYSIYHAAAASKRMLRISTYIVSFLYWFVVVTFDGSLESHRIHFSIDETNVFLLLAAIGIPFMKRSIYRFFRGPTA